ncbi:MAG: NAD(P)-dependent oxidoreductase [Acidimicrobiales bacterium]
MTSALIGSTGFVGSNLARQAAFDVAVHRPDLHQIEGRQLDLVVCAAAPAVKWKANQEPEADLANLQALMATLRTIDASTFVLVSTVDVYGAPVEVDESSPVGQGASAYGRHRRWLEEQCLEHFDDVVVLRLPGLFGPGLKKNVLFDLRRDQNLHLTNPASSFQFYDLGGLWDDIGRVRAAGLRLVNLATEPVVVADIARRCFGVDYPPTDAPVVRYDMRTQHAAVLGGSGHYVRSASQVIDAISAWVDEPELEA